MMEIMVFVSGKEWEECYLQELPEAKNQILNDLQSEVEERHCITIVGDIFSIDRIDHSMATEFFTVEAISEDAVWLSYSGGAS